MLSKADSPVDWSRTAQQVHDQIRGLSPWPGALTMRDGAQLKLHRSLLAPDLSDETTGCTKAGDLYAEQGKLYVRCGDARYVELTEVQPQGSRAMDTKSYLLGHPVEAGQSVS